LHLVHLALVLQLVKAAARVFVLQLVKAATWVVALQLPWKRSAVRQPKSTALSASHIPAKSRKVVAPQLQHFQSTQPAAACKTLTP
jgi:hypothetical protein